MGRGKTKIKFFFLISTNKMFWCKIIFPLKFIETKVNRPQTQSVSIHTRTDPAIMFSPANVQPKLEIRSQCWEEPVFAGCGHFHQSKMANSALMSFAAPTLVPSFKKRRSFISVTSVQKATRAHAFISLYLTQFRVIGIFF